MSFNGNFVGCFLCPGSKQIIFGNLLSHFKYDHGFTFVKSNCLHFKKPSSSLSDDLRNDNDLHLEQTELIDEEIGEEFDHIVENSSTANQLNDLEALESIVSKSLFNMRIKTNMNASSFNFALKTFETIILSITACLTSSFDSEHILTNEIFTYRINDIVNIVKSRSSLYRNEIIRAKETD